MNAIVVFALQLFLSIQWACHNVAAHGVVSHDHDSDNYIQHESHHDHLMNHDHFDGVQDHHHNGRSLRATESLSPCGVKSPTMDEINESSRIVSKWMTNKVLLRMNQGSTTEIETYFHVITAVNGTTVYGEVSDSMLLSQLDVLNDSFRPHGFSFRLMNTTRTNNAAWFLAKSGSAEELELGTALRVGGASTLNVYFNLASNFAGYTYLPESYSFFPKKDGVYLKTSVLPGSSSATQNQGKTLVHEVGHWMGLYHTFQFDYGTFKSINYLLYIFGFRCFGAGDGVDDTPRQGTETSGCPTGKDSCLFRPGVDPIHNYMDYSSDSCKTEFTPGQADRMWSMWNEYRANV
jgi:Pregnancy-associated plasma protein-A